MVVYRRVDGLKSPSYGPRLHVHRDQLRVQRLVKTAFHDTDILARILARHAYILARVLARMLMLVSVSWNAALTGMGELYLSTGQ